MDPRRGRERADLAEASAEDAAAAPTGRPSHLTSALAWHWVSLALGAAFLIYVNRKQWFFGDEWAFLAKRSVTIGEDGIFQPHNEHWSTMPILIYRLLFGLVGVESYVPYIGVLVLTHVTLVHLVWWAMLRSGALPWVATLFCAAFIPFGAGHENLLWAFQIGFIGSVALGLIAIMIADHPVGSPRRYALGWGVSVLALTFSGIAIPLVGASAVAAWIRRGARALLLTASVPAVVFVTWLLLAGRLSPGLPVTAESLWMFPEFVLRGVGELLSLGTGVPVVGVAILLLTGVALAGRRADGEPLPRVALASALGYLFLLAILAVGRAPFGVETASASRYVYIGGALFLPLLTVGLSDVLARGRRGVTVLVMLAVAWGGNNVRELLIQAELQADRERLIREQLVAAGTLFHGRSLLGNQPELVYSPDVRMRHLEGLLPQFRDSIVPSREAVMRAALALQFSVTEEPKLPDSLPVSRLHPNQATLVPRSGGCVIAQPQGLEALVLVPFEPASSLELTSETPLSVKLSMSARGLEPGYGGSVLLEPGETLYLNVAIDESLVGPGAIVVRFPWEIQICGAVGGG